MSVSPLLRLQNGLQMPQIGLGCWKIPKESCAAQVYEAIRVGYRLLDGAEDYGNEKEVGEGVARAISEGLVKREELFVVSKLWNTYHGKEHVALALERTLSDLKLDYLDLFYIHFPVAQKFVPIEEKYPPGFYCGEGDKFVVAEVPIIETWRALEELVDQGKIRSLGISNFPGVLIEDLFNQARIKPQVLQIEHHPYLVQESLVEYSSKKGLAITAYSSFGPLSFQGLVDAAEGCESLLENDTIKEIAQNHKTSPSAVLLRWATQRGLAVIPKSSRIERLKENIEISDIKLSEQELKAISSLDRKLRFNDPWNWAKLPTFI